MEIPMTLTVGTKAPDFTLPATGGETITLSALQGAPVVVYFYPKDDTPGCTVEACDFRDNFNILKKNGITVIGISKDSIKSHEKFKAKFDLNFPLASDEEGKAVEAYGVWVEKSMYGKKYMGIERATFLIDAEGNLARIWNNVKVAGHAAEVLEAAKALKNAKAA